MINYPALGVSDLVTFEFGIPCLCCMIQSLCLRSMAVWGSIINRIDDSLTQISLVMPGHISLPPTMIIFKQYRELSASVPNIANPIHGIAVIYWVMNDISGTNTTYEVNSMVELTFVPALIEHCWILYFQKVTQFIDWLDAWAEECENIPELEKDDICKAQLSPQTIYGWKMSCKYTEAVDFFHHIKAH